MCCGEFLNPGRNLDALDAVDGPVPQRLPKYSEIARSRFKSARSEGALSHCPLLHSQIAIGNVAQRQLRGGFGLGFLRCGIDAELGLGEEPMSNLARVLDLQLAGVEMFRALLRSDAILNAKAPGQAMFGLAQTNAKTRHRIVPFD